MKEQKRNIGGNNRNSCRYKRYKKRCKSVKARQCRGVRGSAEFQPKLANCLLYQTLRKEVGELGGGGGGGVGGLDEGVVSYRRVEGRKWWPRKTEDARGFRHGDKVVLFAASFSMSESKRMKSFITYATATHLVLNRKKLPEKFIGERLLLILICT